MRILILILLSIVFAQSVNAKSWLIINKQTKEILSLSPENDAQLPNNTYEKISSLDIVREESERKSEEEKLITERMRKIARDQLVAEGIINE